MWGATKAERDVSEEEGNGFCRADGVFAGLQEKEPKGGHFANGVVADGVRGKSDSEQLGDDGDWDGFDAFGRRIGLRVGAELAG